MENHGHQHQHFCLVRYRQHNVLDKMALIKDKEEEHSSQRLVLP